MIGRLLRDRNGAAAAEMALVAPLLLVLAMGSVELGNYFSSEHILLKGVRDGAVYAARQNVVQNYPCPTPQTVPAGVVSDTKELTRTGQLSGGTDRLPNWTSGGTVFTVTYTCVTAAGGTALNGVYTANAGQVPVVTVTAQLPYRAVIGSVGFNVTNLKLNAAEQAAATGL